MELIPQEYLFPVRSKGNFLLRYQKGVGDMQRQAARDNPPVRTCDAEPGHSFAWLSGHAGHRQPRIDTAGLQLRIQLKVLNAKRFQCHELYLAENSVPVYLCKLSVGVIPFMGVILESVVDADGDTMHLSRRQERRQVMPVRYAYVIATADFLGIDPYRAEPMGAFQIQHDTLSGP